MNDVEKEWMLQRQRQVKYRKLYNRPMFTTENGFHYQRTRPGGIFDWKTRHRLLGFTRKVGRDKKNANFWYDVRETVKTALIDLQLFIETAEDENVAKVLTKETMEAIVQALFTAQNRNNPRLIAHKVKIARFFAESGLEYLLQNSKSRTEEQLQQLAKGIKSKNDRLNLPV